MEFTKVIYGSRYDKYSRTHHINSLCCISNAKQSFNCKYDSQCLLQYVMNSELVSFKELFILRALPPVIKLFCQPVLELIKNVLIHNCLNDSDQRNAV